MAERLKKSGAGVVLRLAFAEPGEKEGELPPRAKAELERKRALEVAAPAALHKAGVAFAISTAGVPGDKPWEKFAANLKKAVAAGLPADAALAALTTNAADLLGAGKQLGRIEAGRPAHFFVADGDPFAAGEFHVKHAFADGVPFEFEVKKPEPKKDESKKKDEPKQDAKKKDFPAPDGTTEIEADRKPATHTGGNCLIRGATVISLGKAGIVEKADVEIRDGKIVYVGAARPGEYAGATVIDAKGMTIMPGIIDSHAHFAISHGVNEFSLSVVPEVRVRDVVDSEDVQIYRTLAGGVTTARLLHGSANVIGGQDAVIKLKYGKSAKDLLVTTGPRGVKFALGENVKRTDGRFPNLPPGGRGGADPSL